MGKTPFDEAQSAARQFAVGFVKSLMYIHAAEELMRQEEEVAAVTRFLRERTSSINTSGSVGHMEEM